jgi:rhodanese-related sulfurtransferase
MALRGRADVAIVDLREKSERERHGTIPGSLHAPFLDLQENIRGGRMLDELAAATGKRIVFYCAFGERSAMAVQTAQDAGLKTACHIQGGIDAWKKADGPLARRAWSDESQSSLTPNKSMRFAACRQAESPRHEQCLARRRPRASGTLTDPRQGSRL